MMRFLSFASALVLVGMFAVFSTACGDDGYWDDEGTTTPVVPAAPSEILIQKVTVHETDNKGCVWDGPTCTPFVSTGLELPDPYAIADLIYHEDTYQDQGSITSKTCKDTLTCTFSGFGFSLPSPTEDTWNAVKELRISFYDEDTSSSAHIGSIVVPKSALEGAYKTGGTATLKAPLSTRIVSVQLKIK